MTVHSNRHSHSLHMESQWHQGQVLRWDIAATPTLSSFKDFPIAFPHRHLLQGMQNWEGFFLLVPICETNKNLN